MKHLSVLFICAIAFGSSAKGDEKKPAPETFKIDITVMGQNCDPHRCRDNFPNESVTVDIPLTTCDDDPAYGNSCWGEKKITKDFTDADGAQMTFTVTPAHYFNTSNYPEFKKLNFSYDVFLDICGKPTDGDSNCTRAIVSLKDANVPNYKHEFSTLTRADGTYSKGYLWVSTSCFWEDCSDKKIP